MQFTKKKHKKFIKKDFSDFILGGDIGGTHTNLGLFGIKNEFPQLLDSFHFKSKSLKDLYSAIEIAIKSANDNHNIKIKKCCLGIAGALTYKRDYVRLTNANLEFDKKVSARKLGIKDVLLVNDFEAVGYSINILGKNDIKTIKKGKKFQNAPKLVIGAGTGLGKSLLIYDSRSKYYNPLPSEVHHSDFAAQNSLESGLADFIKKRKKIRHNVSNGDILSGEGLSNIYFFLRNSKRYKETEYTRKIGKSSALPEMVSKYRKSDATCRQTFNIFMEEYARLAKNLALDSIPRGGIYIAGGIAQKNRGIFNKKFVKIFHSNQKLTGILKDIPIYLITNSDAGLLGAGLAGLQKFIKR